MRRSTFRSPPFTLLFLAFILGFAQEVRAQQASAADRRDRFAALLLSGADPIAGHARQRIAETRPLPGPASTPALGSPSTSATSGTASVAASRRRPPPSRSVGYLQQRATVLQRRVARIDFQKERLRSAVPVSHSEQEWIANARAILAREERSAVTAIGRSSAGSHRRWRRARPSTPWASAPPPACGTRASPPGSLPRKTRDTPVAAPGLADKQVSEEQDNYRHATAP